MIICEGPDGSGKTQLAKLIAERYGLEYRRYPGLSSKSGPDGVGIVEWWDDQLARDEQAVYDRCFYISEPIYQLATAHRSLLVEGKKMALATMALCNFQPLVIFCLPPWEVAIANIGQRDRLEGVDDKALEKIHFAYWAAYGIWANALWDSVVDWDYTRHPQDDFLSIVSDYIERSARV